MVQKNKSQAQVRKRPVFRQTSISKQFANTIKPHIHSTTQKKVADYAITRALINAYSMDLCGHLL